MVGVLAAVLLLQAKLLHMSPSVLVGTKAGGSQRRVSKLCVIVWPCTDVAASSDKPAVNRIVDNEEAASVDLKSISGPSG